MDHAKRCTNGYSQFGIYGGYALPHMIISQLELIMLAHALDWLSAMTIFTFGPSITQIQPTPFVLLAHPLHTGHRPTPFKLSAHPLLNSDHMTGILHSCVGQDIQICWPRQYLNLGQHIICEISANTLFASYFKSRPRSGGPLLSGKCTTRLDRFKRG